MKSLTLLLVVFAIPLASAGRTTSLRVRVCRCFFRDGRTSDIDTRSACRMVSGTMRSMYCQTDHDEYDWRTTKCLYDGKCWMSHT
ncbi:hypothetical protein CGRA01v4_04258 [Colletotrichum graminicola]|nr:hypothetical protein CGRA01v4_04258 [Colletotrichum graminicola]